MNPGTHGPARWREARPCGKMRHSSDEVGGARVQGTSRGDRWIPAIRRPHVPVSDRHEHPPGHGPLSPVLVGRKVPVRDAGPGVPEQRQREPVPALHPGGAVHPARPDDGVVDDPAGGRRVREAERHRDRERHKTLLPHRHRQYPPFPVQDRRAGPGPSPAVRAGGAAVDGVGAEPEFPHQVSHSEFHHRRHSRQSPVRRRLLVPRGPDVRRGPDDRLCLPLHAAR